MLKIDITDILEEFIIYGLVVNIDKILENGNTYVKLDNNILKLGKGQIININGLDPKVFNVVFRSKQKEYFFTISKEKKRIFLNEISEDEFNKILESKKKKSIFKIVLEKTGLLKKN